jgi:hypothetical protein
MGLALFEMGVSPLYSGIVNKFPKTLLLFFFKFVYINFISYI